MFHFYSFIKFFYPYPLIVHFRTDEDEEFDIDGFIDDFLSDYVENFLEIILYDYIVESIHENYENHMLDLIADENAELEENRLVQNGHGGGHGGQQHHGHGQYSSRIQWYKNEK